MPSKKKKNSSEAIKKSKKESKATKLKEQINSQKNDLEDQKDKYLRLKAEFDNYRRRKEKELIDSIQSRSIHRTTHRWCDDDSVRHSCLLRL